MDGSVHGGHPTHPPSAEFAGVDASGTVRLRIDRSGRAVRVGLDRAWRSAVGPERLGAAVLEALGAAALARLVAWSEGPTGPVAAAGRGGAPTPESVAQLRRAWQDLREFRIQLAALRESTWTVPGPGRLVTAVLRAGQVVGLDLDPVWRRTASDGELAQHIGHTLGAALQQCATRPDRALDGCPDLVAVLADAGSPIGRRGGPR